MDAHSKMAQSSALANVHFPETWAGSPSTWAHIALSNRHRTFVVVDGRRCAAAVETVYWAGVLTFCSFALRSVASTTTFPNVVEVTIVQCYSMSTPIHFETSSSRTPFYFSVFHPTLR